MRREDILLCVDVIQTDITIKSETPALVRLNFQAIWTLSLTWKVKYRPVSLIVNKFEPGFL